MTPSESGDSRRFAWPSDYYSSATPRPVLPQWAALGCGAAATLFLLVLFAGGYFLSTGAMNDFFDLVIGMSVGEMKGQYAADVSAAQRDALDSEIKQMRENLRDGKVSVGALQPFLQTLRSVSSDKRVTAEEAEELESVARDVNQRASTPKTMAPRSNTVH